MNGGCRASLPHIGINPWFGELAEPPPTCGLTLALDMTPEERIERSDSPGTAGQAALNEDMLLNSEDEELIVDVCGWNDLLLLKLAASGEQWVTVGSRYG